MSPEPVARASRTLRDDAVTKTVLVTGAAGFVGANVVRLLLDETDAHVVALDALTYAGRQDNLPESGRLSLVEGDVCDAALVDRLVADCDTRPAPRPTDLATGPAATVRWYREHEDWWRPVKAGTEAMYEELGG